MVHEVKEGTVVVVRDEGRGGGVVEYILINLIYLLSIHLFTSLVILHFLAIYPITIQRC